MAAGLGELILRVGANISEFTSATSKMEMQLGRLGTKIGSLGSDISSQFTGSLLKAASGLLVIQQVMSKVSGAFTLGDDLFALHERTGAAVEDLDRLAIVANLNGASMEDLGKAFKETNKSMAESLDTTSKASKIYEALNISVKDNQGAFRSTTDVMDDTIKALGGIKDETTRAAIGTELLGKAYLSLAPSIKNYAEDSARAAQVTKQFGTVSTETAALVDALGDDFTVLGEGGKRALLNNLVPAFEVARAAIATFLEERSKLGSVGGDIDWADKLVTVLGTVADSFRLIINIVTAVSSSFQTVFADIKAATLFLSNPYDSIRGSNTALNEALEERNATVAKANKNWDELWNGSGTVLEDSLRRNLMLIRAGTAAVRDLPQNSDQNDRKIASLSAAGDGAQAEKLRKLMLSLASGTKAAKDEWEDFADKVRTANFAESVGLSEQTVESYRKLGEALALDKISIADYNMAVERLINSDSVLNKAAQEALKAIEEQEKANTAALESADKYMKKLLDEAGAIGKTGDALIDYNIELQKTAALENITDEVTRRSVAAYYESAKAIEKQNEARKKSVEAAVKGVQAGQDLVKHYQEEAGALGKTGVELEVYNIRLQKSAALVGVTDEAERKRIETLYDTAEAQARANAGTQAYLDEQKKLAEGINEFGDKAKDVFVDFLENGTDAFKRLGANLKKYFINLLAELTIKPLVVNLLTQITGMGGAGGAGGLAGAAASLLGGAGGAAGGGGLGSLGQLGGLAQNAYSLFGGGMSAGGTVAAVGSLAPSLGLTTAAPAIAATTFAEGAAVAGGAGLTTAGMGLAAAIPVVGWAIAAAAAIYAIVQSNKKPTPVRGQFDISEFRDNFEDNVSTESAFGNIGFTDAGTQQFSGEAGAILSEQVSGLLDLFVDRYSDEQQAAARTALQGIEFPEFSGTFTTEDFLKKYGDQILKQVATTAFDVLDPALAEVLEGFQGTGAELTKFIGSLLIFHDLAEKLPDDVADKLTQALDGTQETLDKITEFATALASVQELFDSDVLTEGIELNAANLESFATNVVQAGEDLQDLIDKYDGSAAATTSLVGATQQYINAQVQLIAQLEQVRGSITAMFDDTIRSITMQTLDPAGKGDFLNSEIATLQEQMYASSDPAEIQRLAERINGDINELFGLLTPEEQQQQLDTFVDRIRELNENVQGRITEVEDAAQSAAEGLLTQIQTALADAVDDMVAAADTQQTAANTFNNAVNNIPETVYVTVPVSSETEQN